MTTDLLAHDLDLLADDLELFELLAEIGDGPPLEAAAQVESRNRFAVDQ